MKRDPGQIRTPRRKFLRDVATAGGLAVVAGSAGAGATARPPETAPTEARPKGYRVTAHVSKYYDKARI